MWKESVGIEVENELPGGHDGYGTVPTHTEYHLETIQKEYVLSIDAQLFMERLSKVYAETLSSSLAPSKEAADKQKITKASFQKIYHFIDENRMQAALFLLSKLDQKDPTACLAVLRVLDPKIADKSLSEGQIVTEAARLETFLVSLLKQDFKSRIDTIIGQNPVSRLSSISFTGFVPGQATDGTRTAKPLVDVQKLFAQPITTRKGYIEALTQARDILTEASAKQHKTDPHKKFTETVYPDLISKIDAQLEQLGHKALDVVHGEGPLGDSSLAVSQANSINAGPDGFDGSERRSTFNL